MLFGIGNRVKFIHTGTEGKIVDRLDNGLFIVELDGGVDIPASPEHLQRIGGNEVKSSVKAKFVQGKSEPKMREIPQARRQYEILKSEGIQMAFELMKDGSMQRYAVYMLNDTQYQALYEVEILVKGKSIKKLNGKVDPTAIFKIMEMPSDYLSDNPTLKISCRQVSTEGMTDWLKKEFKLKPKQFFSKKKTAVLLDRSAHVYKLFEPYELKKKEESLKKYTHKKISQQIPKLKNDGIYEKWTGADVKKFANFPLEKDLHIENLVKDHSKMSNGEIMKTQLNHFHGYLDEATRLGVQKVFVIHGIGKGKLRNEIATILMRNPDVKTFKNEYHPKYGTGATEVFFD
jgi:hypothetical protein